VTAFLCAPNAFKGTLGAAEAAHALAQGVRDAGGVATEFPVADGGDGTLDVLVGDSERVETLEVTGPLGEPVGARIGRLDHVAVIELADAAGLRLLGSHLDAVHATTRGLGELLAAALERGATEIIVGVGGSATTDGGVGALQALGFSIRDGSGQEVGPGSLQNVAHVDAASRHRGLEHCRIYVAADVVNPLLGPEGAASVFAPQKGATPQQVRQLEAGLQTWAQVAQAFAGKSLADAPGAGAAGGAAFGLAALCGAQIVPGARLVCDRLGIDAAIAKAGVVVTGEGRLDSQTAYGKAPSEIARRCAAAGRPCIAVVGSLTEGTDLSAYQQAIDLHGHPGDAGDCRRRLREAGTGLARSCAGSH
jgi:glycerate 2-kinase